MPFYDVRCEAGHETVIMASIKDETFTCECGKPAVKLVSKPHGFSMPVESTVRYQEWFHSDRTQADLRSGKTRIAGKGHDVRHM